MQRAARLDALKTVSSNLPRLYMIEIEMHDFLHFVDHNQRVHDIQRDCARLVAEQQSQEDLHTVVQRLVEAHVALLARPNALARSSLNKSRLLAIETLPFRLRDTRGRHTAMPVA